MTSEDKELREKLLHLLLLSGHICKGEGVAFIDNLFNHYLVIPKEKARLVEVNKSASIFQTPESLFADWSGDYEVEKQRVCRVIIETDEGK